MRTKTKNQEFANKYTNFADIYTRGEKIEQPMIQTVTKKTESQQTKKLHSIFDDFFSTYSSSGPQAIDAKSVADSLDAFAQHLQKYPDTVIHVDSDKMNEDWTHINASRVLRLAGYVEITKGGSDEAKRKQNVANFMTAVNRFDPSIDNGAKDVVSTLIEVISSTSKVLVCDHILKGRILRFAVGAFASAKSHFEVLYRGLLGATVFSFKSGKKYGESISTTELSKVLQFPSTSVSSHLLFSQLFSPTNSLSRISTACFLYFITRVDIPENKYEYEYLNFLFPIMDNKYEDKKILRKITSDMLKLFSEGNIYIAENESHEYTLFPPLRLLWHELVRGLLLGALSCCVEEPPIYTYRTMDIEIARLVNSVGPRCYNRRDWLETWKTTREKQYLVMKKKKQTETNNKRQPTHVLYLNQYHGKIDDTQPLVQVPSNVTLVKNGIMGDLSCIREKDHLSCDALRNQEESFESIVTRIDHMNSGLEIVSGGSYYPEINLDGNEDTDIKFGLLRCIPPQKELDRERKLKKLSALLEIASKDARENGCLALVYVESCQATRNIHLQTLGLASASNTLRNTTYKKPLKLAVDAKDRRFFDTRKAIALSNARRKNPNRNRLALYEKDEMETRKFVGKLPFTSLDQTVGKDYWQKQRTLNPRWKGGGNQHNTSLACITCLFIVTFIRSLV